MEIRALVGLAGSIFQFLDFSQRLISNTAEIYHPGDGALDENIDIETATVHLTFLNKKLADSPDIVNDATLLKLCQSCDSVATELISSLNKLKVNGNGKRQKWESFR